MIVKIFLSFLNENFMNIYYNSCSFFIRLNNLQLILSDDTSAMICFTPCTFIFHFIVLPQKKNFLE